MNQKYLKKSGLIALITILAMVPPLSTDLYLPALPEMAVHFHTSESLASMTMTAFFFCMAIGILFFGPLSDKYGRKRVLILSSSMALIFSLVCSFSPSIIVLIIARALQALGAGGMVAISTALIRDSFEGKTFSVAIGITQALASIAPMAAPIAGALILQFSTWKTVFIVLAVLMGIALLGAILLEETLPEQERTKGSTLRSILNLGTVVKDKRFSSLLLLGGMFKAPFMAYLAVTSYIFINEFGVSETTFSIFFAIISGSMLIGPVLYMKLHHLPYKWIINSCFAIVFTSAALLTVIGHLKPVYFVLSFMPFAIVNTFIRPYVSELLLASQRQNVGAASSVMNFGFTAIGSFGMMFGSLPWSSFINGLVYTLVLFGGLSLLLWIFILKFGLMEIGGKQQRKEAAVGE